MEEKKTGISRELLIHPGETIADVLEDRGITQAELAMRTGVTPAYVSNVINGKKDISAKFAMALEYALGVKKSFWLNLQTNYDVELLELNEAETVTEEEIEARGHLNDIVKYLRTIEFIPAQESKMNSILSLRYALNMSNLSNLPKVAEAGTYRMAENASTDPYVLGAWIRMCQIFGERRAVNSAFDKNRTQELIFKLKNIMVKHDADIQSDVTNLMGEYGIDFYALNHFTGVPIRGYVSMKKNGSYQMTVTIRKMSADEFWYLLLHELGHLVNGDTDKTNTFVDWGTNLEAEKRANWFAQTVLLGEEEYRRFVREGDFSLEAISTFAACQNVMPYIVIGRLRKEKYLDINQYSDQIPEYEWK